MDTASAEAQQAGGSREPGEPGDPGPRRPPAWLRSLWAVKKNRLLLGMTAVFLIAFFTPWGGERVSAALNESFLMLGEYAREHVLLCLVPAFFIAGAITIFLNQQAVIRYLGPDAPKLTAYSVASVSGTILAVCSCTVLPLFKGIYKKGAGIGPAVSFLYSGPAINLLAIILTAKVLGLRLGIARAVGAILFSIVVGLFMHLFHGKTDRLRETNKAMFAGDAASSRKQLLRTSLMILSMVGVLVFLNWPSSGGSLTWWDALHESRLLVTALFALLLVITLLRWFSSAELGDWVRSSRDFAVQVLPLLFAGVLLAGLLLGRPGHSALIPESWVVGAVGTNSLISNILAATAGGLMYFATLTEVPIMQGLMGAGMHDGPALALLLAGPSLSLPSLLVVGGELGAKRTLTYAVLVVLTSASAGLLYGAVVPAT